MMAFEYVLFVSLAAVSAALFSYWLYLRKELRHVLPVLLAAVASATLAAFAYPQSFGIVGFVASSIAAAVVSSMLPILYRKKPVAFMLLLFVLAYGAAVSVNRAATVGMFGVGTIIGALYFDRYLSRRREDRSMRKTKTEMDRDLVQMVLGLGVMVVMLIWQRNYTYLVFWAIMLAYLFNNLIPKDGGIYRALSRFERKDVEYGLGAIHLAAGMAILLGFVDIRLALFGVFPLFFGDALATLTGIRFYKSSKLPYNRRKSIAGTLAFFIATAVPGLILLGAWGVPMAIILTIVESVELPIDDNVALPIATAILGSLIGI